MTLHCEYPDRVMDRALHRAARRLCRRHPVVTRPGYDFMMNLDNHPGATGDRA